MNRVLRKLADENKVIIVDSFSPLFSLLQGEEGECESVGGEESEGGSACESSLGHTEGGSPVSSSSLGSQSLELPVVPPASQPEAELQVRETGNCIKSVCLVLEG